MFSFFGANMHPNIYLVCSVLKHEQLHPVPEANCSSFKARHCSTASWGVGIRFTSRISQQPHLHASPLRNTEQARINRFLGLNINNGAMMHRPVYSQCDAGNWKARIVSY